jgi:DNA topoisomerase I
LPLARFMAQWILRRGTARSGFRYVGPDGRPVRDTRRLSRIDLLRIPPAWSDVHIAVAPGASIQAWGFDARGRRQYRYHERAVERRELRKYHRVRQLAHELPAVRRRLRRDAAEPDLARDTVAAIALRLISETFCRVGNEKYQRENGTYGLTTITKEHVRFTRGQAVLQYEGKGGIEQRQVVAAPDLVRLLRRLARSPGNRLFRFRTGKVWHDLDARDVNDYLRRSLPGGHSAKDFRTWGGTLRAATVLAEIGPARSPTEAKRNVALAMRLVGSELGNTATVCRASYVHPMVIARYLDAGETIEIPRGRRATSGTFAHTPEERALIQFLERHFPDRRKARRTDAAA